MNGTTPIEGVSELPHSTACEAAHAYEVALDAELHEGAPDGTLQSSGSPNGAVPSEDPSNEAAPNKALPNEGTAQSGAATSPNTPDGTAPSGAPSTSSRAPQSLVVPSPGTLRLRLKIWTDPRTNKRYLMPTAFMRDVVNGQPVSDAMYAYAMRDDDTKLVTLTAGEWNTLPFFYFQEDGPAPRPPARPVDVIR